MIVKSKTEKYSGLTAFAGLILLVVSAFFLNHNYGHAVFTISFACIFFGMMVWSVAGMNRDAAEKQKKLEEYDKADIVESVKIIRNVNGVRYKFTLKDKDAYNWGLLMHRMKIPRYDYEEFKYTWTKEKL